MMDYADAENNVKFISPAYVINAFKINLGVSKIHQIPFCRRYRPLVKIKSGQASRLPFKRPIAVSAHAADLLDAYNDALAHAPALKAALDDRRVKSHLTAEAIAGFLPKLEAKYDEGYQEVNTNLTTTLAQSLNVSETAEGHEDANNFALQLVQPIFNYKNWVDYDLAKKTQVLADYQLVDAQQNLMLTIAQKYFAVTVIQDKLMALNAEKKLLTQQADFMQKKMQHGLESQLNVDQIITTLNFLDAQKIELESNLNVAVEDLAALTGKTYDTFAHANGRFVPTDPTPAKLQDWVIATYDNYRSLVAVVGAQEVGVRDSMVGVELKVPLFEGGYYAEKMSEAKDQLSYSLDKFDELKAKVLVDIDAAFGKAVALVQKIKADKLLLAGLGKKEDFDSAKLTQIVGSIVKRLPKKSAKKLAILLTVPSQTQDIIGLSVEGVVTALFDPEIYKTKDKEQASLEEVNILISSKEDLTEALTLGQQVGEAINWSRTLIIQPANFMTPTRMVTEARKLAAEFGFGIEVLNEEEARKKGMGAFSAIAQGSDEPSYMVAIIYKPNNSSSQKTLGLVGKGVTFDSGGLSIKPSNKMDEMKMDMAGAATVMAIMRLVGQLKPNIGVVGVAALTENLPSGKAVKPGDVVKAMNGKTIEILDIDAEGRVVLADALVWAQEKGATHLVDLATLTGATIVALGHQVTAVMGNQEDWVKQIISSGQKSGEKMWQLPLFDLYTDLLKSSIADYANVPASRQAGTIAGGMFLKEFVDKKIPWAHLDIAGTAWLDSEKPYMAKGPTGFGIKTIISLISDLDKIK